MGYEDVIKSAMGMMSVNKQKQDSLEKSQAKIVMDNFGKAKFAKEEYKLKWKRFIKLWRGDHWRKNRAKWKSNSTENICFSIIETMIPLMGDRQPLVNYLPQTDEDIDGATKLTQAAGYIWNSDGMSDKFPTLLRDMLILGTAIVKMRWDTEKFNGMGDITGDTVDPFQFFPDPEATDPLNLEWCILRSKMSIKAIQRLYQKEVPSDADYYDDHARNSLQNRGKMQYSETQATILEYWYKDETGRTRVSIVSNGILLDDKESPYEVNEFPFVFFFDHKLNGEFWGIGELENLEGLQMDLNKNRALINDNMIANNNTMIVVDSTAGVKVKNLRNEPGLIVEKQPGGTIQRLAPPQMPSYFQDQIEITKKAMQEVSGVNDISKGIANGQTAASAIQILTENSQTRLRGKLKNVESGVKKIGFWYLVMIRQFYQENRFIRLIGDDQNFQFTTLNGNEFRSEVPVLDPQTGQPMMNEDGVTPKVEIRLTDFDINISSGSSMMMNKASKYQQMLELYKATAVDLETLLKSADVGDPKEIVNRMIKYGVIPDPNAPKVDIAKTLGQLGIKVNLNASDPQLILQALEDVEQQLQGAPMTTQNVGTPVDELQQQTQTTQNPPVPNQSPMMPQNAPLMPMMNNLSTH